METPGNTPSHLSGLGDRLRSSLALKAFLLFVLCLFAAAPLAKIRALQFERESRRNEATNEISHQWGRAQSIVGPILVIPGSYDEVAKETVYVEGVKTTKEKKIVRRITVCVLPDRFELEASLQPDWLYRGIFRSPVYRGSARIEGAWSPPDMGDLGYSKAVLDWDRCRVLFRVSDPRGLSEVKGVVDNATLEAQPFAGGPFPGEWTRLGKDGFSEAPESFSIEFGLRGSQFFGFLPAGKAGSAKIDSPWPDPSFSGTLLPEERRVDANGFSSTYRFSEFGRGLPQAWVETAGQSMASRFDSLVSGVELIDPIDSYRLVDRSLKYGLLFVGIGFGVFFLFEALRNLKLHPMQYVLAGSGIVVFFLSLLSLSEVVAFGWAYLLAATASSALVGLYAGAVLKEGKKGALFGAVLAAMFGFLFVVLRQQDFALLCGTVLVFAILATVMYVTRKFDWGRSMGAQ